MTNDPNLRRILPDDLDVVWQFARRHAKVKWSRDALVRFMADGLNNGLLAERNRRLHGFLLYRLHVEEVMLDVGFVLVAPEQRRRGVGSALLAELGQRLATVGGGRIEALVGERHLPAQLFLRANGFQAVRIARAAFADGQDDGYIFKKVICRAVAVTSGRR